MADRGRRWFAVVGLLAIGGSFVALLPKASRATPPELAPLRYNHPGLVVDLGVGLWAWPIPCDADDDGDYDLIVSCPDKPSNGVWVFENATGDTRREPMPVFRPGRRIGPTVNYLMPSYVDGRMRALSPGFEYDDVPRAGTARRKPLPLAANWYAPRVPPKKGPGVRHNQWRLADFDGDGIEDLVCGIEDWSDYGWDDAYGRDGRWQNGPLHGFVFVFTGSADGGFAAQPIQLDAGGRPLDVFGCPSPNFEDFDGDGDLNLLCGSFLDRFTYFRNRGSRTEPDYEVGIELRGEDGGPLAMELQMIVPVSFDWNRDGHVDLIVGDEDGRVALGDVEWLENIGTRTQPRLAEAKPLEVAWEGEPPPLVHDFNGDGLADLAMLDHEGYLAFFERARRDDAVVLLPPKRWFLDEAGQPLRLNANQAGGSGRRKLCLVDWDGDGRLYFLKNPRSFRAVLDDLE